MSDFIKDVSELVTETLDKAYLEYSNLTLAKTKRELELEKQNKKLKQDIEEFIEPGTDQFVNEKIQKLQVANDILMEACEFYADPYNYTPDRDAMYGNELNLKAFKVIEKAKEIME